MRLTEGHGGKRPVALCWRSYDAEERARSRKYAGRFADGYVPVEVSLSRMARVVRKTVYSSSIFKDGIRLNRNFIRSHYCVLDFDDGRYTLAQAIKDWSDTVCIIGTTASHQTPKVDAKLSKQAGFPVYVKSDRFRIIAPWERPVDSAYEFTRNVSRLVDYYGGDPSCSDPARLWYPCSEIVACVEEGYLQPVGTFREVQRLEVDQKAAAEQRRGLYGKRAPKWVTAFITRGSIPKYSDGRQRACFDVACCLRDRGWDREEVRSLLHGAKFTRADFDSGEIDHAVDSAFKEE